MNTNQVESVGISEEAKKIFSNIGFALVLAIISSSIIGVFIGIIGFMLNIEIFSNIFFYVVGYISCYLVVRTVLRHIPRESGEKKDFSKKDLVNFLLIGEFIAIVGNFIGIIVLHLVSGGNAVNVLDEYVLQSDFFSLVISACVLAPIFEELIFRKLFIDIIAPYGEKMAIVFSAFCFAIFHMNFFQMIYAFGLGLLFGYVYIKSRKITYTIALHTGINFIGAIIPKLVEELPNMFGKLDVVIDITMAVVGIILFLKNRRKFVIDQDDVLTKEKYSMFLNGWTILLLVMCLLSAIIIFKQSPINIGGI